MIRIIKIKIKEFITIVSNMRYNKKHHTRIYSKLASPKAIYEKGVNIAENTVVTEDVHIGIYSYINKNSSVENCEIGNYCSISSGVYINPFEHNLLQRSTHPFVCATSAKRDKVKIGNDVLISLNVVILQGVQIGNGAIIGAGAIVTKDVKPYEIVGGVPARHIGWRFDESGIKNIEETQWWNYDISVLNKNSDYFTGNNDVFSP